MTMICMECECNILEFVAQENYFENKTNIKMAEYLET